MRNYGFGHKDPVIQAATDEMTEFFANKYRNFEKDMERINWSVLKAVKMWLESIFPFGIWCKVCSTRLVEKESWEDKTECLECRK